MTGIVCAGHWVVDHIKFIDQWPDASELCNISSELISNGGGAFNVIVNLANLKVKIPTYGLGCIGNDIASKHILNICKEKKINIKSLQIVDKKMTSYTDVMTTENTGVRTMFHHRGANQEFCRKHVPFKKLKRKKIKLFYLGHLLLMDALEKKDEEFNIIAARLLHEAKKANMETVVDVATEHCSEPYKKVVIPCLPYIDHLVINELEAEKIADIQI